MPENDTVVEQDSSAIEAEARAIDWVPKEEFRGDPNKWVDAQTWVDHSKAVMPILRKTNEKLTRTLESQNEKISSLQAAVEESQATIQSLQQFHEENVKQRVEKARADLLAEIEAARGDNDVRREVEAVGELSKLDAATERAAETDAAAAAKKGNGDARKTEQPKVDPVLADWATKTGWYGVDPIKTGLADGVALKLRQDGEKSIGVDFLLKVQAEVEKTLGGPRRVDSV